MLGATLPVEGNGATLPVEGNVSVIFSPDDNIVLRNVVEIFIIKIYIRVYYARRELL